MGQIFLHSFASKASWLAKSYKGRHRVTFRWKRQTKFEFVFEISKLQSSSMSKFHLQFCFAPTM